MSWYWTDDLAQTLLSAGQIEAEVAERLSQKPVAIRAEDIDSATLEIADDDELPLAA